MLRSPKLHAAYESQLPELPAITDDIGHILVHYLHTGNYESLKPKEVDTLAKQIAELRTSIRAYATARAYDLPDLMKLAEKNIQKYGEGVTLPILLEITKEAHPNLSEVDVWFLGYLKSRIRPHLENPKELLGSNLLDQISSILSPNRVLLRTVLEMFCERITPATQELMSPITSPSSSRPSSRPVSPSPTPSNMSVLQMRSRAVPREDFTPQRKRTASSAATVPWPLAEDKEGSPAPSTPRSVAQEVKPAKSAPVAKEAKPQPIAELEPVIVAEPATIAKSEPTPVIEKELKAAIEAHIKPVPATPPRRRGRKDSAKVIPQTPEAQVGPVIKELEPISEPVLKTRPVKPVLREVDSGFWDMTPSESEPVKESTPSMIEIDPEYIKALEPAVHELHATPAPLDKTETLELAVPEVVVDKKEEKPEPKVDAKPEPKPVEQELPLAPEVSSRDPLDPLLDLEPETDKVSEPTPEPILIEAQPVAQPLADSRGLDRISEEDLQPEKTNAKKDELTLLPELTEVNPTDKSRFYMHSGLTVHEAAKEPTVEPETKTEYKPQAEAPEVSSVPDAAVAAGPSEAKTTEPDVKPVEEPAREAEILDTKPLANPATVESSNTASDSHKAAAPADAKQVPTATTNSEPVRSHDKSDPIQQIVSPERQKSWRKRFLKVPVLFSRGN